MINEIFTAFTQITGGQFLELFWVLALIHAVFFTLADIWIML